MSRVEEMRRVMAHAANRLGEAVESGVAHSYPDAVVAMGYARGVLDLLGTYLAKDGADRPDAVHLVDASGDLWQPMADGRFVCLGADEVPPYTRADVEATYGPVREALVTWLR